MIYQRSLAAFLTFVIFLSCFLRSTTASILAIDYGTEFIKASLIKPGVPFDVLLNRDSKRKIASSVAWKGDERLFGAEAFNLATRFPTDSFTYLKLLQGVPFDSDPVNVFRSISPAELVPTSRGTVGIRRGDDDGTEYSVEELIGMQLSYVKELAESYGSPDSHEAVRDAVLVVPPYFTQFERDAIVDALEIAGLRLAALVNDGSAVALNYAMTRSFSDKKEWHVIYDAGAGGIRATVVSFESLKLTGRKEKEGTQITVAGVGFDRSAGGIELDRRLRDILTQDFELKHKRAITNDARGMARLWKEAGRVKAILSANTEATASVESIAFDIDYKTRVSRTAFEDACSDLRPKFAQPILDAIINAGLTLDNITSVILTGGHSRTPMVQASVRAAVGDNKIATSVNADEAAVLGAALYGASVSPQFRSTKDIKITDIIPYDIQISYPAQPKTDSDDVTESQAPLSSTRILHSVVFPAGSKVGSKKTMTFKRKDDFVVKMGYKDSVGFGFPSELLEAEITGIKDAFSELAEAGATEPVVKAVLQLSESGFAGLQDAVATSNIKKNSGSFSDRLKGFFGSDKNEDEEGSSSSSSSTEDPIPTSSLSSTSEDTPSSDIKRRKEVRDTIPLKLTIKPLSIPALSPGELRKSRDRLISLDTAEAAKRRKEEARNGLEAYLYRLRDLLDDEHENPFKKCSTLDERRLIEEKVYEFLRWMSDEADEAELIDFWERKDILERLERPIQFRYTEIEAFPSILNNSQRINWMTRMFITEAHKNLTMELQPDGIPAAYTAQEIDDLEVKLKEHEKWLAEWVEKQKSVKPYEDPVILTSEMKSRATTLESALLKLMKRKPPKARKSTGTSSSTSGSSSPSVSATKSESPGSSDSNSQKTHDEL